MDWNLRGKKKLQVFFIFYWGFVGFDAKDIYLNDRSYCHAYKI